MSQDRLPVQVEWARDARVDATSYAELYERSLADPDGFWLEQAARCCQSKANCSPQDGAWALRAGG